MNANVTPIDRARRPRRRKIVIEQLQYAPEQWLVACECGGSSKHPSRDLARRARRRHQADHDRAEAMHPAGKASPAGGDPA